jgi:hypothetical protein
MKNIQITTSSESNQLNMIPNEHSGVAHVQQKFTDRNRLAHVEQNSPSDKGIANRGR